ncbi:MAG: GNAT family N-acetyltransferase [Vampirovibrio sp.]|nr:GNAT family N-acetyltransferase [Vampirovibrio sp.]
MTLQAHKQQPHQDIYSIRVVQTITEFNELEEAWGQLLTETGLKNINLEHLWLKTFLTHFPPESLCVILVENAAKQLVAAAPMKIDKPVSGLAQRTLRCLEFIGATPCVYEWMQILIRPGEDEERVITYIAKTMAELPGWDVLNLQFLQDRKQLDILFNTLDVVTENSQITQPMSISHLALPNSVEEYDKTGKKKSFRRFVKKGYNRLATDYDQATPTLEITTEPSAELDRFFEQHIAYWKSQGGKSDFVRYPDLKAFYKDLLINYGHTSQKNGVMFSILQIQGQPMSYQIGYWSGISYMGHIASYMDGFQRYSPGVLHYEELIHEIIRRKGSLVEFGRGDDAYKSQWTQTKTPLWSLLGFRSPVAKILWQTDECLRSLLRRG